MTTPKLVIGAPVWNRSWCLPTWFDSVEANVDPENTGLIFVVPPSDAQSREVIAERSHNFAFVEVLRDKYEQHDRELRRRDNHQSLAQARNSLLQHVAGVGPDWYLSWDSDFLIWPGTLDAVMDYDVPVSTVWAWLNRRPPRRGQHWLEDEQRFIPVEWDEPMNATAMDWDKQPGIAVHKDPRLWTECAAGFWPCDVVLAWQLMKAPVYSMSRYGPHPHGEDIPFNLRLHQQGIRRFCYGAEPGLHLFDQRTAETEIQEGYPAIMRHAHTDLPLAATRQPSKSESLRVIGYYEQVAEVAEA